MSGARERLAALAPLIARLQAQPGREDARALAQELLAAHRDGLARLLAMIGEAPAGAALMERLCADADVAALLMLHGLHPETLEARVRRAVTALAPRLAASHVRLALAGVDADGVVRLRLEHAGPRGKHTADVEAALCVAAADATDLRIDEVVEAPLRFAAGKGA